MLSLPEALLREAAFPHAVHGLQLIETHLSWVFLTGEYVYKLKKPVQFDFVDFSSLALRRHFCFEEVRCNRAFAPELYLDVVAVVAGADGEPCIQWQMPEDQTAVLEYAVCMRHLR